MSLDGSTARVAVITGASSGIGEATARAVLARHHAQTYSKNSTLRIAVVTATSGSCASAEL